MLSDDNEREVAKWHAGHGHLSRPCPMCGKVGWKTGQTGALPVQVLIDGRWRVSVDNRSGVAVALLECLACGFFLPFSLDKVLSGQRPE